MTEETFFVIKYGYFFNVKTATPPEKGHPLFPAMVSIAEENSVLFH